MKKNKIKFDYKNLRALDMVCCAGRSPFAFITRLVTAGWKHRRRKSIAVHTAIVVDLHGQKLIVEMQPKGIEINSLEKYSKVGGRRWVISVRRHPLYDFVKTRKLSQRMIMSHVRRHLDYDYTGLLEFISDRVRDNKERFYCSEYFYHITMNDGVVYPKSFSKKVSPYDLQVSDSGWCDVPFGVLAAK